MHHCSKDVQLIVPFIQATESFKFILELLPRLPSIKRHLAINQVISIPPEELILPTLDGGTVSIPIPSSHIGKKPIHVRLLSSKRRLGMVNSVPIQWLILSEILHGYTVNCDIQCMYIFDRYKIIEYIV